MVELPFPRSYPDEARWGESEDLKANFLPIGSNRMSVFGDAFLPEFDQEMRQTRDVLEVLPDGLLDWKAADEMNTVGWVASHLADTLSWVGVTLNEPSFDVAPIGGTPHETEVLTSAEAIRSLFDRNLKDARELISVASDESFAEPWSLLLGGEVLYTMSRSAVVRMLFLNHMIHHRAFLLSYLRQNNVACPAMYG